MDGPNIFQLQYVWNSLNEDQKRLAKLLTRDDTTTIGDIANEMKSSSTSVRRIRNDALEIALIHLNIRKRTKNKKQQATSNKQQIRITKVTELFCNFSAIVWRNRSFS